MIRVLTMIAVAGFILSVGALAGAVAVGGPDILARSSWNLADGGEHDWHLGWDSHDRDWYDRGHHGRWSDEALGPETTRTLAWSGAERLDIDLAADVRYVQAPGPGSVVLTGPQAALAHVEIDGDSLRYDHGFRHRGRPKLSIVVSAPNVTSFNVSGDNSLTIEGYRQARLSVDASGESEVVATGAADEIRLNVSGSGDANLGAVKAKGAEVEISGDGDATVAPTERAKLDISGNGDVRLLTTPKSLETEITGDGRVRQGTGGSESPSPSPSPSPSTSPSPSPSPRGAKT